MKETEELLYVVNEARSECNVSEVLKYNSASHMDLIQFGELLHLVAIKILQRKFMSIWCTRFLREVKYTVQNFSTRSPSLSPHARCGEKTSPFPLFVTSETLYTLFDFNHKARQTFLNMCYILSTITLTAIASSVSLRSVYQLQGLGDVRIFHHRTGFAQQDRG